MAYGDMRSRNSRVGSKPANAPRVLVAPVSRAIARRAPRACVTAPGGPAFIPPQYALTEFGDVPGFGGFSFKSITKAVKKVASPLQKAVAAVGHAAGNVATSKLGQGILGTALAVTGVGAPAAAAIFAATKAGGNLIKPGGNLKHAATGAAQGAVEGLASVAAGKLVRGAVSKIRGLPAGMSRSGNTVTDAAGNAVTDPDALTTLTTQAERAALVDRIATRALPGAYVTASDPTDAANLRIQANDNAAQAALAAQQQAQQLAELTAQQQEAMRSGNDALARSLAQMQANAAAQSEAARQAAAAAQDAATRAQGHSDDQIASLAALVQAGQQATNAAIQSMAANPASTAQTRDAVDASQAGADAVKDGQPNQAGIGGTIADLVSNPVILGAVVVGAIVLAKKRRRRA